MATYSDVEAIALATLPPGPYATTADEPEFAKLVRSSSFILTENNPFTYEAIRQITPSVFWRMYLRIASARNTDNNFLYTAEQVVEMIRPTGGMSGTERYDIYGGSTQWVAAKLVAAHLVRNIPLNTSSIKQVDIANNLETQALEDLEYIIKLYDNAVAKKETEAEQGQVTLYIAHDLDKASIPEPRFDIPVNGDYSTPIELTNVEVVDRVSIPVSKVGFCYFYMTAQLYSADKDAILSTAQNADSDSISRRIEGAIQIRNGDTIDDIITNLADAINGETLTQEDPLNKPLVANILVAPERGIEQRTRTSTLKKYCYPETTINRTRQATFDLCYRTNKLHFEVRRYSNKSSAELLNIVFYTTDQAVWDAYTFDNNISNLKSNAANTLGIDGLIFGQQESYNSLGARSPFGVILNVEKGNVTPVSIQNAATSTDPSNQFGEAGDLAKTDTFYFNVNNDFTGFTRNLLFRISSNEYQSAQPVIVQVDLSNITPNTPAPPNCVGEEVARRVVDAIFEYTRGTHSDLSKTNDSNVLACLLGEYNYEYLNINRNTGTVQDLNLRLPNDEDVDLLDLEEYARDRDAGRVQIVGFRYKEDEFKITVDIIQIPTELYVATGNYITRRTHWVKGKPRSICIETKVLNTGGQVSETTAEELSSVNASVSKAKAEMSPILQQVYDKRKLLKDSKKGFPRSWSTN